MFQVWLPHLKYISSTLNQNSEGIIIIIIIIILSLTSLPKNEKRQMRCRTYFVSEPFSVCLQSNEQSYLLDRSHWE